MRAVLALLVLLTLVLAPTGCIAYRAATPAWLDGGSSSSAPASAKRRSAAIRRRGVIAASVGTVELVIATAVTAALMSGGLLSEGSGSSSENPAGAFGESAKDLGGRLLGVGFLAAVGVTALVSGIGDVACGAKDLVSSSTCDATVRTWYPELAQPTAAAPAKPSSPVIGPVIAPVIARPVIAPVIAPPAAPPAPVPPADPAIAADPPAGLAGDLRPRVVNPALIAGDFEPRGHAGTAVVRFADDGTFRVAVDRAHLDLRRFEALGTWRLDGDQLALTRAKGTCADAPATQIGVYVVSVAKIGLRLRRLRDACPAAAALDGATLWRLDADRAGAAPPPRGAP
jgi:hypothetical protein